MKTLGLATLFAFIAFVPLSLILGPVIAGIGAFGFWCSMMFDGRDLDRIRKHSEYHPPLIWTARKANAIDISDFFKP